MGDVIVENGRDLIEVRKPTGRIVSVFRRDLTVYTDKGYEVVRCLTPSNSEKSEAPKEAVTKKVTAKKSAEEV